MVEEMMELAKPVMEQARDIVGNQRCGGGLGWLAAVERTTGGAPETRPECGPGNTELSANGNGKQDRRKGILDGRNGTRIG